MKKQILFAALSVLAATTSAEINFSGSVQSDMMVAPQVDEAIGAYEDSYDNKSFLTNTYAEFLGQSQHVDFGARLEFTQWPMPGFDDANNNFKGWGLPNFWVKGRLGKAQLTLGTFYEQFGSGFILRNYEQRSLGVDNSLLGARLAINPVKGVNIKALSGLQRRYWSWDKESLISGADLDLNLSEWFAAMSDAGHNLTLGGSWVNKYEKADEDIIADDFHYRLNVPEFVNAFDVRAQYQYEGFSLLGEYAQKSQDPNSLNNYTYGKGSVAMLSMTYTEGSLSLLAQAKRAENMGFRSIRKSSPLCSAGYINHMPAFTLDHTYALAALYPYATQMEGEWAFQGQVGYNFKRKTTLGGKYGTKVKLNYSLVKGVENNLEKGAKGSDGADNGWFAMGDTYYQDLNLQVDKRLTKEFELHLMYMYQQYNKGVVQLEGGNIYSNIFVAEGKYKFNKKYSLRGELQYLTTEHESDDWYFGLLELSMAPHFMFTVSDQIGRTVNTDPTVQKDYGDITHFYTFAFTYNYNAHRAMLSYGRTRAGYNCTGGVCRYVPASKGLTINYSYSF